MAQRLMEGYPLNITVPGAELQGTVAPFRHTEYLIEVDDCGRTSEPFRRRYSAFTWLHTELHRESPGCALPELPGKKAFRSMDPAFVEERRKMLEHYLQALLRLPEVINGNAIWCFLDADVATAVVPRFLCRQASPDAASACLLELLDKVVLVAEGAEVFRMCNSVVADELLCLLRAEKAQAVPPAATGDVQQLIEARLNVRLRLCAVLRQLLVQDRSETVRVRLAEAGLFKELLELLLRSTEDCEEATRCLGSALHHHDSPALRSGGFLQVARDEHRQVCEAATACLDALIQGAGGVVFLQLCAAEGGWQCFRRVVEADRLHLVAATLLWHGLQHHRVATALGGQSGCGVSVLGRLLQSADLKARVLAGLCVGCVLRREDVFNAQERDMLHTGLKDIPAALDAQEAADMKESIVGDPSSVLQASLLAEPPADPASDGLEEAAGSTSAGASNVMAACKLASGFKRDPELVAFFRWLCSPQNMPKLQDHLGCVSASAALVTATLDHFVRLFADEPVRLRSLSVLMPLLWNLMDDSSSGAEDTTSAGARHVALRAEIEERAAKVLVSLQPCSLPGMAHEPSIGSCCRRVRLLEALTRHAAKSRGDFCSRLLATQRHEQDRDAHVRSTGLVEELVVTKAQLAGFGDQVAHLAQRRGALGSELGRAGQVSDSFHQALEQDGVKHGVLQAEVAKLTEEIGQRMEQEERRRNAQEAVSEKEAASRNARGSVDRCHVQLRESVELSLRAAARAGETESRTQALHHRESELLLVCQNAPANSGRLKSCASEARERKQTLRAELRELIAEVDMGERRLSQLQRSEQESTEALRQLAVVTEELASLKSSLSNELYLSKQEVEKVKRLDLLQPPRPRRLRRPSAGLACAAAAASPAAAPAVRAESSHTEEASGAEAVRGGEEAVVGEEAKGRGGSVGEGGSGVPDWEKDFEAELGLMSTQNFRTFAALHRQRTSLWGREREWLQAQLKELGGTIKESRQRVAQKECDVQDCQEEEDQLWREIAILDDHDGHACRHSQTSREYTEALKSAQEAKREEAEALQRRRSAESDLERAQQAAECAASELEEAKQVACEAAEDSFRACTSLEGRCLQLEEQVREHLKGGRALVLQELRVDLLQVRAEAEIAAEAQSRATLQAEVRRLIEDLHRLDKQLDGEHVRAASL